LIASLASSNAACVSPQHAAHERHQDAGEVLELPQPRPIVAQRVAQAAVFQEYLPDDLAWSVARQAMVVDRRRYDHWSLGRVNRRCEVGR
jgi:hypothetical protein